MAAVTPVTDNTTAGHTVAGMSVYGGVNPISTALITVGKHHANRNGAKLSIFYFSSVDDTDTWASGIKNIIATAWQADQADADICATTLTTALTGEVTWDCQNASSNGWLWVLHGT